MSVLTPPDTTFPTTGARRVPPRRRRRLLLIACLVAAALVATTVLIVVRLARDPDSDRHFLGADGWPAHGQAAYALDAEPIVAGPHQHMAPIASLAKMMTAYLVLSSHPLALGANGFTLRVTAADVADTAHRAKLDESLVPVRTGEVLTERQALEALLLPSANNVAAMLARRVQGSVAAFVARMNDMAHSLGMAHTIYTDPSGFDDRTRSTAADQVRLAQTAMRIPAFRRLVRMRDATIPVAGRIENTDSLLGTDGIVGIKTGSDDAAGGCFAFRAERAGHVVTGVVLGQEGHFELTAGLYGGKQLADRVLALNP